MFYCGDSVVVDSLLIVTPITVFCNCSIFCYCGSAAYLNFNQNTHQIQVLTKPLCRAQAILYSLPNNEWVPNIVG